MSNCSRPESLRQSCFDDLRQISDIEVKEKDLDQLTYGKNVEEDLSGDGIKEEISLEAGSTRLGTLSIIGLTSGRDVFGYQNSYSHIYQNLSPAKMDVSSFGLALFDVNGDGLKDLIYRGTNDAGAYGYHVFINRNTDADVKLAAPSLFAVRTMRMENDGGFEIDRTVHDEYSQDSTIITDKVITGLAFNVANAAYVQIENGPIVPVEKGKMTTVEGSGNVYAPEPLSLKDKFDVTFHDSDRRPIKAFHVSQRISEKLARVRGDSGIEYVLFSARSEKMYAGFANTISKIDGEVMRRVRKVSDIWGNYPIRIVLSDRKHSPSGGTGGGLFYDDGRLYIWSGVLPEKMPLIAAHEYAHNIESFLAGRSNLLDDVFDKLKKMDSPVFQFADEYFGKKSGEHSGDHPCELFATITLIIADGPDVFRKKLGAFTGILPKPLKLKLRKDLKMVFDEYERLLTGHGRLKAAEAVTLFRKGLE